jgi:GntR family transcriptional repressor for pyruvate dehydrogenase complex
MGSEGSRPASRPVLHTTRVPEAVAAQLRLRIIDGDLPDGAELPTEAVLLGEFDASRPSLREAFRILETEGLVRVRRGKRGGTVIKSPTDDTAAYHMGLLLHSQRTPMTDLAEARNLVEPLCAEQAARRRDHKAVGDTLTQVNDRCAEHLEDDVEFTNVAIEFHEALVDAAGNMTLRVIAGMLESVWSVQEKGWAKEAAEDRSYPDVRLRRRVVKAHQAIADAIRAGEAAEASDLTRRHLEASQLYVAAEGGRRVHVLDEYGSSRMPSTR